MDVQPVAVVGGGLAGLTAAVLIARAGQPVTVFERASALGGRASTDRHGEHLLNRGPHALCTAGAAATTLAAVGVRFSGGKPPVAGGIALRGGNTYRYPAGPFSLVASGLLDGPGKREAMRVLPRLAKIDAPAIEHITVADWLRSLSPHVGFRDLLEAYLRLTTYAHAPDIQSAGTALAALQTSLAEPTIYVDGGWGTLVEQLRGLATDAGVSIQTAAPVTRVVVEDGRVVGVETSAASIAADAAVLTGAPADVATLLDGPAADKIHEVAHATVPVKLATLDIALRRLPDPRRRFVLGIDEPTYLSVHSASARLAPSRGAVLHAALYLRPGERGGANVRERLEAFVERFQPGWRKDIVHARYLPEMTVSNALDMAASHGRRGRAKISVTGTRGLYVAGDWVGSVGILADAAVASAQAAARALLEDRMPGRPLAPEARAARHPS